MNEFDVYSDLINFVVDPMAYENLRGEAKYRVCQASGLYLHTTNNLQIMDFTTGLSGINLGHNHPSVLSAVTKQMETYSQSAGNFDNTRTIFQLRKSFSKLLSPSLFSFNFTNTEELAIKYSIRLARTLTNRSAYIKFVYNQCNILNNFSSSIHINNKYKNEDDNRDTTHYFLECRATNNYLEETTPLKITNELISIIQENNSPPIKLDKISAIIVGIGDKDNGFLPPPNNLLSAIRSMCDQYGILLIINEGGVAIGRTGTMVSSQGLDIDPDLIILGKGIANGYSLGCVVIKHGTVSGLLEDNLSTIEFNPISCAAALATLEAINDKNLLINCREMGIRLLKGLLVLKNKYTMIRDVRGSGLNLNIELSHSGYTSAPNSPEIKDLVYLCLDNGLLVYRTDPSGRTVCLMPPLNVTEDQVDQALCKLDNGLENL